MNPMVEIGEILISDRYTDYFFRPSFTSMSRIGSPVDIVEAYANLNGYEVSQVIAMAQDSYGKTPEWLIKTLRKPAYGRKILSTAMHVMQSCCDEDVTPLIGEWRVGKKGVIYHRGSMSTGEIILIAHTLIEHGVMGKAKIRKPQRAETNSYVNEFRAIEYINSARIHFGISRAEAELLTMTEFQLMLNAKYPDQKGFTREEYDTVRDDYFKRREERIAAEKAKKAA
ncbi:MULTISPECIES: DUF6246 family protein [Yersinia]|uniref:DUF6246 family protein n=1 Tax=Yersinia TaxID=629 RepID=UPI0009B7042B|nr:MULTISPECIES: DUF6246 family protein [Yersinia]ARB85981.1 hypothetical protein A6J67_19805 [Yersinia sp. FDAARGOS_228]AVL35828.1 hypothetical protein CEQ36_09485 [Yersinia intermedia]